MSEHRDIIGVDNPTNTHSSEMIHMSYIPKLIPQIFVFICCRFFSNISL